jgi:hypothetical protein
MQYFIKGNFYFDIDSYNQLRVTGPENHLLFGATFHPTSGIEIVSYKLIKGQLQIIIQFEKKEIDLAIPLVCDIRTLRSYIETKTPKPSYEQLVERQTDTVMPREISAKSTKFYNKIQFINEYFVENHEKKYYGSEIIVRKPVDIYVEDNRLHISGKEPLKITIRTLTNLEINSKSLKALFRHRTSIEENLLDPEILRLYKDSKDQIKHLIKSKKTSSFEYGTIFPRDWIESADLGLKDLTTDTIDYMYDQSMQFISEFGEGWHENAVGEFKYKTEKIFQEIDRRMIDIEPRYILGLKRVSKKFLTSEIHHQKLLHVSKFILENARSKQLITFKKSTEDESEYLILGNWRDSSLAYPKHKQPLAPYDVNCVFYPQCLRIIREYSDYFEIDDLDELDKLIAKWDNQKIKFRLYHTEEILGYSLALHGKKNIPLTNLHLDESYDLFYGNPSLEEVISFAIKVVDPEYFYTPVGPLLVAADDEDFSSENYHGRVIWPKQAAFTVAGLTKQYFRGLRENWQEPVLHTIRDAVIKTSEACFRGWKELGAVPELYFYDESTNHAKLYTDQQNYEGQMSLIQLWSSIGCRRIIHDYISVQNHK